MITAAVPQSNLKNPSLTSIAVPYLSAWEMCVASSGLDLKVGLQ